MGGEREVQLCIHPQRRRTYQCVGRKVRQALLVGTQPICPSHHLHVHAAGYVAHHLGVVHKPPNAGSFSGLRGVMTTTIGVTRGAPVGTISACTYGILVVKGASGNVGIQLSARVVQPDVDVVAAKAALVEGNCDGCLHIRRLRHVKVVVIHAMPAPPSMYVCVCERELEQRDKQEGAPAAAPNQLHNVQ